MNARTRLKLEDDFPEITDALLDVLYPHYLRPVPSMAVVQFHADRTQAELAAGYTIARESPLETETIEGEPCRFRTCYPVTLWPLDLTDARLTGRPFTAPTGPVASQAAAVLRLEMVSHVEGVLAADGEPRLAAVLPARTRAACVCRSMNC